MKEELLIGNSWQRGQATAFSSHDPATSEAVWKGHAASEGQVSEAVEAAAHAFFDWSHAPLQARIDALLRFSLLVQQKKNRLAEAISQEVGKPLWESLREVEGLQEKVRVSLQAYRERSGTKQEELSKDATLLITRHRAHGPVVVLAPFNLPAHISHGHIVPALLAGNTVIYKPSEKTPYVGELLAHLWEEADVPPGVLNLVQGGPDVASWLALHPQVKAVFFTGSARVGHLLARELSKQPEKMLVLEMGGNNPLLVFEVENLMAAAYLTVESAFITSGQRCSCARRLIISDGAEGQAFLDKLLELIKEIKIGPYTETPEPFMGPLISSTAAEKALAKQREWIEKGANSLLASRQLEKGSAFLTPGVIDMSPAHHREDDELFAPLLKVIRVSNFHAALREANQTAYGLTAGLLSDSDVLYQHFLQTVRAGVVNRNAPLTGSSSLLPFGGIGSSGNFRPSGYYAVDYCAYPVASNERSALRRPLNPLPGLPV